MSHTISIDQASAQLRGLLGSLGPKDEIVLTDNDKPVARIVPEKQPAIRTAGSWRGKLEIKDDSDDAILEHFKDYIP